MKSTGITWYLVRHALATRSRAGYGDTILTASILPDTVPAIREIGKFLSSVDVSGWYSSDLLRCRQTSEIIRRETEAEFQFDSRLKEYHGETFSEFSERVTSWARPVVSSDTRGIVVVTHGAVIAFLKHYLVGKTVREEDLLDYPQCGQLLTIRGCEQTVYDFRNAGKKEGI